MRTTCMPEARLHGRTPSFSLSPPAPQLMYKLRMELGDADFARIFDDPRIRGIEKMF